MLSFIPLGASILASIASDRALRIVLMFATGARLIYNMLIGSPLAIALEAFSLTSNFVGFWRFHIRSSKVVIA